MKINLPIRKGKEGVDPIWHVQIAVFAAILLQLILPDRLTYGTRYLIPALEIVLLIGLSVTTPVKINFDSSLRRLLSIALIAITTFANLLSLQLLVYHLLKGGGTANGIELITSSIAIYLTNIIIFALWYWEIDGGGPGQRASNINNPDFLFPQMTTEKFASKNWKPTFIDYLYVSSTNATAFSPTDTMPLTHTAKLLMLIQSLISLVTIALVAARAVNILQ